MKRLCLIVLAALVLAGCGPTFGEYALYRNWAHLKYSWWGYKQPVSEETIERSQAEEWFGNIVTEPGVIMESCD